MIHGTFSSITPPARSEINNSQKSGCNDRATQVILLRQACRHHAFFFSLVSQACPETQASAAST
jgi:hypothetical protein